MGKCVSKVLLSNVSLQKYHENILVDVALHQLALDSVFLYGFDYQSFNFCISELFFTRKVFSGWTTSSYSCISQSWKKIDQKY